MTITTLDQATVGMQPATMAIKSFATTGGNSVWYSTWGLGGSPPAGSFNTTLAGGTYSCGSANANLVGGQIYRLDPPTPKRAYVGKFGAISHGGGWVGMAWLCDRLWDNGGITVTSTTAQTVNSPTWPARDEVGGTAGVGVLWGMEVSAATGANHGTVTITYTNSNGTSGRTAGLVENAANSAVVGQCWRGGLASGDRGVQSIQSVQLGASFISGTINLFAYRILGMAVFSGGNAGLTGMISDPVTSCLQRVWNGTVPFILFTINVAISTPANYYYQETWG